MSRLLLLLSCAILSCAIVSCVIAGPLAAAVPGNTTAFPTVRFEENRGQTDPRVRYYAQGSRYAFYLTRDEVVLSFMNEPTTRGVTLALLSGGVGWRAMWQ